MGMGMVRPIQSLNEKAVSRHHYLTKTVITNKRDTHRRERKKGK